MPMIRPPLESLLEKVDNKYALVITVAKRARQLKEGHLPMVDIGSTNPVTVALEDPALAHGVNTAGGHVTHPAVAAAHGMEYVPLETLLR